MRRRAAASAALVIVAAAITSVGAQGPAPVVPAVPSGAGTAAISGIAVDGSTNQPLAGVVVFLGPTGHGPPNQPLRQVTDAKGRFVFSHLPAYDGYSIIASKFGYFDGRSGRTGDTSLVQRIVLADGQWLRDMRIVMNRPAAISGTVVDDRGEPIVGAFVRALLNITIAGHTQLASASVTVTDDRGSYRLSNLGPGKYYVQIPSVQNAAPASTTSAALAGVSAAAAAAGERAGRPVVFSDPVADIDATNQLVIGRYPIPPRSSDGRATVYPPTFYPDVFTLATATTIAVSAGDERSGIELRLAAVPAARISGTVGGPAGTSLAGLVLRLMVTGVEDLAEGGEAATTVVGADNTFTFVNVPAGAYVVSASPSFAEYQIADPRALNRSMPRTPGVPFSSGGIIGVYSGSDSLSTSYNFTQGTAGLWARQPVRTDGRDLSNVVVTMKKTSTISGRYVFDFAGARPSGSAVASIGLITAQPAHGTASLGIGRARSDPQTPDLFAIDGLMPGEYVLAEQLAAIESVTCGATDYTNRVFDMSSGADFTDCVVTVTDKFASLSGAVRDERGQIAADVAVIAFPVDPERRAPLGFSPITPRRAVVSTAGTYRYPRLLPLDYFVIAVPGDRMTDWRDLAFLQRAAAQASRVHLTSDQNVVQDLVVKVVK